MTRSSMMLERTAPFSPACSSPADDAMGMANPLLLGSLTWRNGTGRLLLLLKFWCGFGALLGLIIAQVEAGDWPNIRGPKLDAHSDEMGIVELWSAKGPPVLWSREMGQGYSSFIAWDRFVATQYQTLSGQYLICLDAETGETVWEHRYGWPYDPAGVYPGPRSTPTLHDGKIYFTSPTGHVGCVQASNGRAVWSLELAERFENHLPGFGFASSPIIDSGRLYLPVGGPGTSMVALDPLSGRILWKAGDDLASYTPAFPILFQGRKLILGYLQNALVAHDGDSGQVLFRYPLSTGYDEHSAWPLYQEPYLWISAPFRAGSELLRLEENDGKVSVRSIRRSKVMSNDIFSSLLHEQTIYGFDLHEAQAKTHRTSRGVFQAIDWMSGEVLWTNGTGRLRSEDSEISILSAETSRPDGSSIVGHCSVLWADGKLVLFNDLGELILARAERSRYQELGRQTILGGEIGWTQPALSNGCLYVRSHTRAACIYLRDPATLPQRAAQRALHASEIKQPQLVDLPGWILGIEPEYLFDAPKIHWLWRWYWVSWFGLFGGSWLLLQVPRFYMSSKEGAWLEILSLDPPKASAVFWCMVFGMGCMGTTCLSWVFKDFVFTWPLSLYVVFHIAIANAVDRQGDRNWKGLLRSGLSTLALLLVSLLYFWLCRRLSLVFEWAFLGSFGAALPFLLMGKYWFSHRAWSWAWQWILSSCAFAAYYWSAALFILLRY